MKIIYLANARIPTEKAHGISIMKMCEAFSLQGAEVELVVPRRMNKIKEDPFDYYGVRRNFKIKKLLCLDLMPLEKIFGTFAFRIQSLTFYFFAFFRVLFLKADIIYTRDNFILFYPFLKRKIFFEAHRLLPVFLYSRLARTAGVIAISHNLKNFFCKKGIREDKILVFPSAVDLERFDLKETQKECREKLNLPLDKNIVLHTGHLFKENGPKILAEASQYVSDKVKIYFVGGTKADLDSFKSFAGKFDVEIMGHRLSAEIPYWLRAADVLVLPYISGDEYGRLYMSSMKLFEYMASKRPIVASELPSLREILNESNAFFVMPDSPQDLAKGINKVLDNPELAGRISEQAYKDVQKYTWGNRARNILHFMKNNFHV